jgi:molecular chaperone DnaK
MSKKVIGIDLGTGFSAVSTIENDSPVVIANSEGGRTTPSVVQINGDEVVVGNAAKRSMVMKPKNTVQFVKRLMGCSFDDENVQKMIDLSTYEIVNKNNKPYVRIDEKDYSPEQISSMILGEMKKTAEEYLGTAVTDAVITCPAWFNDVQRNATKTAGELAGLNVLRIINEPTAAILSSSLATDGKDKTVAVVDAGCGTLDVSVCEISDGMVEVLSSDGDVFLGGKDYDDALVKYIVEDFNKKNGIDLSKDQMAYARVLEAAEKAKCELSSSSTSDINLSYIAFKDGSPIHLTMSITRAKFERLIEGLNQRTVDKALSAISKAKISKSDVDSILLVGGTTRIPSLQEALKKNVCENLSSNVNPDEAVTIGAAKQADILAGNSEGEVLLLDVTPISLGIETLGGVMTKLVEANTTIPTSKKQTFSTAADNQSAVTIRVLQGERYQADDNKTIGVFTLDGILPAKRGVPQIEVSFDIDANGIISVSAKDLGTNKEQHVKIENQNLSEDEINKIKADAEKFAEADKKKKENQEILNTAEVFANSIRTSLDDSEHPVPMTDEIKMEVKTLLDELDSAVAEKDVSKVKEKQTAIQNIFNPIMEELYKATQSTTEAPSGATE